MSILEGQATLTNLPLGVWAEEDNCRRNWEASSSAASARSRNATGIPEKRVPETVEHIESVDACH